MDLLVQKHMYMLKFAIVIVLNLTLLHELLYSLTHFSIYLAPDTLSYVQEAGSTALMNAACDGRTECVKLLLDGGANKEARDIVCEERPLVMPIEIFVEGTNVFLQIFA